MFNASNVTSNVFACCMLIPLLGLEMASKGSFFRFKKTKNHKSKI